MRTDKYLNTSLYIIGWSDFNDFWKSKNKKYLLQKFLIILKFWASTRRIQVFIFTPKKKKIIFFLILSNYFINFSYAFRMHNWEKFSFKKNLFVYFLSKKSYNLDF